MTKVAVVTGASAGVGRATARLLADRGYDVGLLSRSRAGLDGVAEEVRGAGRRAVPVETDVADAAAVDAAAEQVEASLGPIDVWVNNAMASVFSPFLELTAEEFERVVAVTFLGQVNGTRAALRRMVPRDRGAVVEVGSALAYRGIPLQSAYCASKHATQGLCDSLRAELHHDGSRVHLAMVQLPALNTPQFDIQRNKMARKAQPVPPIFQPELAAEAIVAAAEQRRREVWVGWPTTRAILADKMLPGALDRLLGMTGYESQLRQEPVDPDAPDVLFTPIERDLGAHGAFGDRSRERSRQQRLTLSRPARLWHAHAQPRVDRALARLLRHVV